MRSPLPVAWCALAVLSTTPVHAQVSPEPGSSKQPQPDLFLPLNETPFTEVRLQDDFWSPRARVNATVTVTAVLDQCEKTGRLKNFAKAAGQIEGEFEGYFFNDSDVYKAIEGASEVLALLPPGEDREALAKRLDRFITTIIAAQQPDGYLNTYFTLKEPGKRWTNIQDMHEMYCAGHLIEAGIAHNAATGDKSLLDAAVKFADHIDTVFGPKPGQRKDVSGHEEIELALFALARHTGQKKYAELATFLLDQRGNAAGHTLYGEYHQDHKPVREQTEAVGHAVRAMYLWSAAADLAILRRAGGHPDKPLEQAMNLVWEDLTQRKMYVTGGIGNSSGNEGFTKPYDLPNATAYSETCASIGLVLWAHRMNLLTGDARYADVLERSLYNAVPSGVSESGDRFFYTNPLASRGQHLRQPWFACACCPPNILRTVATVGRYFYASGPGAIYVNLYGRSEAKIRVGANTVTMTQATTYPWNGRVTVSLRGAGSQPLDVFLRIPDWSLHPSVEVNGHAESGPPQLGYVRVRRVFQDTDRIEVNLGMGPRRILADPHVKSNAGRAAIQYGPLVYCAEEPAAENQVFTWALTDSDPAGTPSPSTGVGTPLTINVSGLQRTADHSLDNSGPPGGTPAQRVSTRLIPYCTWANNGPRDMTVWFPEKIELADRPADPTVTPSASHCFHSDSVRALCDFIEPGSSADNSIPRMTWWPHKGTAEWAQYDFTKPRRISAVEVYWFDDTTLGAGCALPTAWTIKYKSGDQWLEVSNMSERSVAPDRFNRVTFPSIETIALRLEVQLADNRSAGILEWRLQP